jgi:hypothetical protein
MIVESGELLGQSHHNAVQDLIGPARAPRKAMTKLALRRH